MQFVQNFRMNNARDVFDEIAFDIEYFKLDAPYKYKRFLGEYAEWQGHEFIKTDPYIGFEEHYPPMYEKFIRASDELECSDLESLNKVMEKAREYIKIFYYPCRISLMRPNHHGWFELVSCLLNNRTEWAILKGNFHVVLRNHTFAFYGLHQQTTPQTIFDFLN